MKINKETIPTVMNKAGMLLRSLQNFGTMTVTYNELPAGTNFSPLLKGLKNNHCHSTHYGTVLEGAIRINYQDGTEELICQGDLFYIPAGHTAFVEKDLKIIVFSTSKEHHEVMNHVVKQITHN
ncbi:hypothetical protein [Carboxylicivirga taeanensis]|uniref:hypothetical protein n=1 Tax=Carboxylicivirga taeanensis TaxID=1416875 RepID=UPI003F6E26BA